MGGLTMNIRKLWLFPLTAVLGAAVVVLPAAAASEAPTVEATTMGCYLSYPCWTPTMVTIASGGVVKFANKSSTLEQGVRWIGSSAPSCENVPSVSQKGTWEGSCTFNQPGSYKFDGTQLYSYSGEVVVTGTPATTTTGSTTTPAPAPMPSGPSGPSGASPETTPTSSANSLFAGSPTAAVKLAAAQHGPSVHGSVEVSQGGSGGRLEVQLLSTRASLASVRHPAPVRVGRLVRSPLSAGAVSFMVPLDAKARHALHARHRLALSVKVLLTSAQGSVASVTRRVTVHR
jgi:plastocyanin